MFAGGHGSYPIVGTPDEVADMALFLSSKMGAAISGQAIGIDGHTEGLSNWLI